jgi:hypothetical protein
VPVGNDVADESYAVHALGELVKGIVAGLGMHALQIGYVRRVDSCWDKVLVVDQLRDLRADHFLKDAAEPSAVASAWCCCDPQDDCLGIASDDRAPCRCRCMMALIEHDEIGGWELHRAAPGPRRQCLDSSNLRVRSWVGRLAGQDGACLDAEYAEFGDRLV